MDFSFSPEDEAFREEVRAWLKANLPESFRRRMSWSPMHCDRETMLQWTAILNTRGWAAPHWPREYGGPGFTHLQRHIFQEECYRADAPVTNMQAFVLAAPIIYTFGSAAQKARYLPGMLEGREYWTQGFSEPNAGSDLASLKTTAILRGDRYVVNGSKIWTSGAHEADWGFFLVRTNTEVKPQAGISFLLIDVKNTPGITIRPLISIDGAHHLNQVFLEDVEVPAENLVGEPGKGWSYGKFLLENERTDSAFIYQSKHELDKAKEIAARETQDGVPLIDIPEYRKKIARFEIDLLSLEWSVLRVLCGEKTRWDQNAVASVLKIRGAELQQRVCELQAELLGTRVLRTFPLHAFAGGDEVDLWPDHIPGKSANYMLSRAATIYGGAKEIQKNIIARLAFGL